MEAEGEEGGGTPPSFTPSSSLRLLPKKTLIYEVKMGRTHRHTRAQTDTHRH